MAFTVTLAGQDITPLVDEFSIRIESLIGQGPGSNSEGPSTTCAFNTSLGPAATAIGAGQPIPATPTLVRQGEVIITDAAGNAIFGGYAAHLLDTTVKMQNFTTINCMDYFQDLDRIICNEVYSSCTDTFIINDLFTKYAPWISLSPVNVALASYLYPKFFARGLSLKKCLLKLCKTTGYFIWVDATKTLNYLSPSQLATAPFSISDTPDYTTSQPARIASYERDDTGIVNRIYFFGGKKLSPDFTQDVSPQASATNTTFILAYFPHPATDGKVHVYVNGAEQTVGKTGGPTNAANTLKSAGGSADCLLNPDADAITFSSPHPGATVTVKYRYQSPIVMTVSSQASHDYFGAWYDAKVVDDTVFDTATAATRCRLTLAEQAYGLEHLVVVYRLTPGLAAGMTLQVVNTKRALNATYAVQKVSTHPLGAGNFEYTAELGAWKWNILDLVIADARTSNDQDNTDDTASILIPPQLPTHNHTSTFTVATGAQTGTMGVYYSRSVAVGDHQDAYSGFFTVTS